MAYLQEHLIVIQEDDAEKQEVAHVNVVESFVPNDDYDLVLVVMGEHQGIQIFDTLAENDHVPTFRFMGNHFSGCDEMLRALGNQRVMLGFPYPGGKRDGHVMRVLPINEENVHHPDWGGRWDNSTQDS